MFYTSSQQALSVKGKIVNILGFADHTVSVITIQLCHWITKTALENPGEWCGCVPHKNRWWPDLAFIDYIYIHTHTYTQRLRARAMQTMVCQLVL